MSKFRCLTFRIVGVQIRHEGGSLSVHLPTHRVISGIWRPVIEMPEELRAPLANALMEFLAEGSSAERRF
jgi:hypothetical protein